MKLNFPSLACLMTAAFFTTAASAQVIDFPSKPIRLIIPYEAGGATDVLGRLIANKLATAVKQPVVVENKAGAGGSIGASIVAKAKPDGYTLLLGTSSTHAINQWLYKNLSYDVTKDFASVSMVAKTDYALTVPAASPAKTVADIIKTAKTGRVMYASNGNGTTSHLASALLGNKMHVKLDHIPYRSSSPAVIDLIAGNVDYSIDNTSTMIPNVKSGKLRILATTGAKRSPVLKNVPTMMEAGVPDYDITGWWVISTTKGTPNDIVSLLNTEITEILNDHDVQAQLMALGIEKFTSTPDQADRFIAAELIKFKNLVAIAGAKIE
ncbi:Bug family tripartite tricarboxylate transporter substrate binding protein [Advenella kashmirensis]